MDYFKNTYWAKRMAMLFLAAIPFIIFSCDNFVEVELPDSQLTGVKVFEDPTTANAAMADIYAKLRDSGLLTGNQLGISGRLGLYTDELTFYGSATDSETYFYNNSLLATDSNITDMWNVSYNQIYESNALIEGVANSVALPVATRNQFTGEALFVRALVHFYLLNLYGDIPYITTTDYEVNKLVSRMPTAQVYARIIADLDTARELLPEEYLAPSRVRPNKSTADALLARAYLYSGAWAEAANSASAVINNPAYVWETNLDNIFLKESTTTIWQFQPKTEGRNTDEGATFIFASGPPYYAALNNALVNAFDPADLRRSHWVGSVTDGTDTWYYANKYKQNDNTGSSVEYSIVFRLAEQYLIRAEARARQGELIGALEDLNKIRSNAGLPDTNAVTADQIVDAVITERRFEFFTEYGHRFFDLKRTGNLDAVLSPAKPGWNATDALWPLPATDLIANPNLRPQNAGY